jgi:hypothetical protein
MAGDFVELIIHRTDALSRLQACPDQRPLAKDREPLRNRAWGNQSHRIRNRRAISDAIPQRSFFRYLPPTPRQFDGTCAKEMK